MRDGSTRNAAASGQNDLRNSALTMTTQTMTSRIGIVWRRPALLPIQPAAVAEIMKVTEKKPRIRAPLLSDIPKWNLALAGEEGLNRVEAAAGFALP